MSVFAWCSRVVDDVVLYSGIDITTSFGKVGQAQMHRLVYRRCLIRGSEGAVVFWQQGVDIRHSLEAF